jgi:hypothetical protein
VLRNLTLTVDQEVLRAARKVALDRDTSVNQLVREFLDSLVREAGQRQAAVRRLDRFFRSNRAAMGPRTWTREDLHER